MSHGEISKQIEKSTLEKSIYLVGKLREQTSHYIAACENETPEDRSQVSRLLQRQQIDVAEAIMKFPGQVVTTQLLLRKIRGLHALSVKDKFNSLHREIGQPNYIGKVKNLPRGVVAFYKAPWRFVDQHFVNSKGISEDEYKAQFDADMSMCPVSGLIRSSQDWREVYQSYLAAAPHDLAGRQSNN